jgi:hypothetical protein
MMGSDILVSFPRAEQIAVSDEEDRYREIFVSNPLSSELSDPYLLLHNVFGSCRCWGVNCHITAADHTQVDAMKLLSVK